MTAELHHGCYLDCEALVAFVEYRESEIPIDEKEVGGEVELMGTCYREDAREGR